MITWHQFHLSKSFTILESEAIEEKLLLKVAKYWKQPPVWKVTYLSVCPAFAVLSALIRVSAAAASSNAQLTEEVSLRSTSGSANALPSAVDSLPIPFIPSYNTSGGMPEKERTEKLNLSLYDLLAEAFQASWTTASKPKGLTVYNATLKAAHSYDEHEWNPPVHRHNSWQVLYVSK